jgi:NADPH:quinone reductase
MRAVQAIPAPEGGKLEVRDVPEPIPGKGQVLVKVRASGLNRGEITQAKALLSGNPAPVGVEFAGEIAALGTGVNSWHEGDRVMGHGRGGQAEYVLCRGPRLRHFPMCSLQRTTRSSPTASY